MHPDRKIGFALGILLVGIVAALFFRNEPLQMKSTPTVRREHELNQRLRDRDVAVYLDDAETMTGRSAAETHEGPNWTLPELVDALQEKNSELPAPITGTGASALLKSPESNAELDRQLPSFPSRAETESNDVKVAVSNNVDSATTDSAEVLVEPPQSADFPFPEVPAGQFDEYVVEYGDTLSGIAERFLGSQSRYSEIFDANRDRLAAPDKLRVGKAIRIPRF